MNKKLISAFLALTLSASTCLFAVPVSADEGDTTVVTAELQVVEPMAPAEEISSELFSEESQPEVIVPNEHAVDENGYVSPIDFDYWNDINPDVYAWIEIPDTNVDFPMLQHPTEDNYYLDYTVYNRRAYPGSVYTQTLNTKHFTEFCTVIYGHNMNDGSLFGQLYRYRNLNYLLNHQDIYIYTREEALHFKVFASVVYTNELIPYKFDFSTEEGCMGFIDSLNCTGNDDNHILEDYTITPEDRLIVISTCTGRDYQRYLILAVLQDE